MPRAQWAFQQIYLPSWGRTSARITFDATGAWSDLVARSAPARVIPLLERALREAALNSILRNLRHRFIKAMPNALEMETVGQLEASGQRSYSSSIDSRGMVRRRGRARETAEQAWLIRATDRLARYQGAGQLKAAHRVAKKIQDFRDTMVRSLNRSNRQGGRQVQPHRLSSGLFRPRMIEVLARLCNPALMTASLGADGNELQLNLVDLKTLSRTRTPSATEYVLKLHRSRSLYQVMWRHLEFGTGVHSTLPEHPLTYFSAARYKGLAPNAGAYARSWYYSRRPPLGMLVRGSKGMHFLRTDRGGVYQEDFTDLQAAMRVSFAHALGG